jgi:hypothetical protein
MKVELFAACDYAADYAGKLTLVGVFDTLGAPSIPVVHPQLSVVAKLRFDDAEAGHLRALDELDDLVLQFGGTPEGRRFQEAWQGARVIIDAAAGPSPDEDDATPPPAATPPTTP